MSNASPLSSLRSTAGERRKHQEGQKTAIFAVRAARTCAECLCVLRKSGARRSPERTGLYPVFPVCRKTWSRSADLGEPNSLALPRRRAPFSILAVAATSP